MWKVTEDFTITISVHQDCALVTILFEQFKMRLQEQTIRKRFHGAYCSLTTLYQWEKLEVGQY